MSIQRNIDAQFQVTIPNVQLGTTVTDRERLHAIASVEDRVFEPLREAATRLAEAIREVDRAHRRFQLTTEIERKCAGQRRRQMRRRT